MTARLNTMEINQEASEKYTIQAYSEQEIQIDSVVYRNNLVISPHEIISDWPVKTLMELNENSLSPLLRYHPKIILIGHNQLGQFPSQSLIQTLAKQGIGLESMSIGAACRTFNVLLSEQREIALGLLF